MFTFPPSKWVGGIFYEHGHRLIASTVGFLTIVLAVWLWRTDARALDETARREPRSARSMLQGVLGGVTVLYFLPTAGLDGARRPRGNLLLHDGGDCAVHVAGLEERVDGHVDDRFLRRVATTTTTLIYVQILLGATMRHSGAGLAIPDFPLMFGGLRAGQCGARRSPSISPIASARSSLRPAAVATSGYLWRHHSRSTRARPAGSAARRPRRHPDHAWRRRRY